MYPVRIELVFHAENNIKYQSILFLNIVLICGRILMLKQIILTSKLNNPTIAALW
jgi:hypothetical protein